MYSHKYNNQLLLSRTFGVFPLETPHWRRGVTGRALEQMATHGSLTAFDPSKEDWTSYVLHLKYYFDANGVNDAGKKKSLLLTACGPATFRRISSLLTSDRLEGISNDDLVSEVKDFYDPKLSIIVQRYQFYTREPTGTETIATYVAALRKLAEHCSYGDKLNEMIRDWLVCGVNHATIQPRLLAEKIGLAQAVEAAEKNTKILSSKPAAAPIHYSNTQAAAAYNQGRKTKEAPSSKKGTPTRTCYRCGGPHLAPACTLDCYCCKKGHLEKVCKTKARDIRDKSSAKPYRKNLYVDEGYTDPEDDTATYGMFTIQSKAPDPITMDIHINEIPIKMVCDTGAALSIISSSTYQSIAQKTDVPPLKTSDVHLRTYTGEDIKVMGTITVRVRYDNQVSDLSIQVVEGVGPDLVGRDWLEHFKVSLAWTKTLHCHFSIP